MEKQRAKNMKIKCTCGGAFEESIVEFEGFNIEGMKCNKCSEVTFLPEQFKKVLHLKELAKEINSIKKIVKIGNSLGLILPKGIEKLGLKVGKAIELKLENSKKIELILS